MLFDGINFEIGVMFISKIPSPFTLILKTSSSTVSSFSIAQIVFEYDRVNARGGGSKLVKKLTKVKKLQRPEES